MVIWTLEAVPGHHFGGSFLSQAALAMLAIPIRLLPYVGGETSQCDAARKERRETWPPTCTSSNNLLQISWL
ncbi:hypothetical protein BN77_p2140048 [Rhizobium mesoamericanum STM3625]|uniref:Uncharacterized protein n=1 Tax=Rhizobium mesoamericanum STM3625 TaxID=1211777 RepID=K0PT78_9HYPH|nr:hypothetical protein BN77_p2140048 [Rhizobium mesoamericanum STM3625]